MAVSERNAFAIQLLLDAGADPDMPTRIDETFRFLRAVRGWPLDVTSR